MAGKTCVGFSVRLKKGGIFFGTDCSEALGVDEKDMLWLLVRIQMNQQPFLYLREGLC